MRFAGADCLTVLLDRGHYLTIEAPNSASATFNREVHYLAFFGRVNGLPASLDLLLTLSSDTYHASTMVASGSRLKAIPCTVLVSPAPRSASVRQRSRNCPAGCYRLRSGPSLPQRPIGRAEMRSQPMLVYDVLTLAVLGDYTCSAAFYSAGPVSRTPAGASSRLDYRQTSCTPKHCSAS